MITIDIGCINYLSRRELCAYQFLGPNSVLAGARVLHRSSKHEVIVYHCRSIRWGLLTLISQTIATVSEGQAISELPNLDSNSPAAAA